MWATFACPVWDVLSSNTIPAYAKPNRRTADSPRAVTSAYRNDARWTGIVWLARSSIHVYKATVETDNNRDPKIYHLMSFRHEKYGNQTELSKYIWNLKRERKIFSVSLGILRKAPAYLNLSKKCDLCLTEKLMIISTNISTLLNRRFELISKCRHKNKLNLTNFASGVT